jgi:hypothetical protein
VEQVEMLVCGHCEEVRELAEAVWEAHQVRGCDAVTN